MLDFRADRIRQLLRRRLAAEVGRPVLPGSDDPLNRSENSIVDVAMAEVIEHTKRDNISVAQLAMANEIAVSGKSEEEINAFLDKILGAMDATVKTGLAAPTSTLPGPIKLKTKAHDVYEQFDQQGCDGANFDRTCNYYHYDPVQGAELIGQISCPRDGP